MSKIKMAKEILEAMEFLGIPAEKFQELCKQHGGLEGLHAFLSGQF